MPEKEKNSRYDAIRSQRDMTTRVYIQRKKEIALAHGFDPKALSPGELILVEREYGVEIKKKGLGVGSQSRMNYPGDHSRTRGK